MNLSKSILAACAFAAVLSACNNTCKKDESKSEVANCNKAAGSCKETNSQSIVFVNTDSLLNNYEYFKKIKSQLDEKSKKAKADLNSKGISFQKEVADYQKNAGTLTAEQRAATEQRLMRKKQELEMYGQNASNALMQEEGAELEKLQATVSAYLKKHAKDKGYKMVLTYSKSNPGLLYADEGLDVTKDVLKGLNEDYKK